MYNPETNSYTLTATPEAMAAQRASVTAPTIPFQGQTLPPTSPTLTAQALAPTPPITLPTPKTDTTNPFAEVTHGQGAIDQNNKALTPTLDPALQAILEQKPQSYAAAGTQQDTTTADTAQTEANTQRQKVSAAQSKLAGIQAQIQGIVDKKNAENLSLEQNASGFGMTTSFLNARQNEVNRQAAIAALPLQSLALAAQAEVASAQGQQQYADSILKQAQDKLDKAFELKKLDIQTANTNLKDQQDAIRSHLNAVQIKQLDELQKKQANDFTAQSANINDVHNYAAKLGENGQVELATKMFNLDPKSPTYMQDFANLVAQGKAITAIGIKTTMGVDLTGLPSSFTTAVQQGKTGTDLANALPPIDKATIQSILDYTKNPANLSLRKPAGEAQSEREKFLSMAHLIDPTYDESQYPARSQYNKNLQSGTIYQSLQSAGKTINHLSSLLDAMKAMDNGNISSYLNAAGTTIEKPLNKNLQTAVQTAKIESTGVADELSKFFKGTGVADVQSIKDWKDNLSIYATPSEQEGIKQGALTLLTGQLDVIYNQYTQTMGHPPTQPLVPIETLNKLDKLGFDTTNYRGTGITQNQTGTAPQKLLQPTEIPPGYYQASDGLLYKK